MAERRALRARVARESPDRPAPSRGALRIRVVAELTGVPEPTLRAWERRYGIPTPERTASGYRLYSARDVEQVRELRRLCAEGMAASEAATLLLKAEPDRHPSATSTARRDPPAAAVESLIDAVVRFDDVALEASVRELMLLGSTTEILDHVLVPVLHQIGTLWHQGELSVAQEHLASQRLSTLLRDLLRLSPGAEDAPRAILACFADDDHELGLLGAAMRFSSWGLRPIFLGARTPPGAVRSAVEAVSPALVALSVTVSPPRARARELVDDYANACGAVPWIVGGAGAADIADLVRGCGGNVAPSNVSELRGVVRATLERPPEKPMQRSKPSSKKP